MVFAMLGFALVGLRGQGAPAAKDEVRLLFEITKNGTLVAKPLLRIALGQSGSLTIDTVSFSVVPTRVNGDISLQFEFKDGPKPRLVLKGADDRVNSSC